MAIRTQTNAYVYGVIAHCLFEDRDKTDFLFSDGILFTFDFAEGFRSSDFSIMVMEHQEQLSHLFSPNLVDQLATSSLDYYPSTLAAYELLVNDQHVCDKAYLTLLWMICVPVFYLFQMKKSKAC